MKSLIFISIILAVAMTQAVSQTLYDPDNLASGKSNQGRIYDSYGTSSGRIDKKGRIYDSYGTSSGRIDKKGRIYDSYGDRTGRIDDNGRIYDEFGLMKGRIKR